MSIVTSSQHSDAMMCSYYEYACPKC